MSNAVGSHAAPEHDTLWVFYSRHRVIRIVRCSVFPPNDTFVSLTINFELKLQNDDLKEGQVQQFAQTSIWIHFQVVGSGKYLGFFSGRGFG